MVTVRNLKVSSDTFKLLGIYRLLQTNKVKYYIYQFINADRIC